MQDIRGDSTLRWSSVAKRGCATLRAVGASPTAHTGRCARLGDVIDTPSIILNGREVQMLISKDIRPSHRVKADAKELGWRLATHDENFGLLQYLRAQPQGSIALTIYRTGPVWGRDGYLFLDRTGKPSTLGFYEQQAGLATFRLFVRDEHAEPPLRQTV